jgi:hypothetical protein
LTCSVDSVANLAASQLATSDGGVIITFFTCKQISDRHQGKAKSRTPPSSPFNSSD